MNAVKTACKVWLLKKTSKFNFLTLKPVFKNMYLVFWQQFFKIIYTTFSSLQLVQKNACLKVYFFFLLEELLYKSEVILSSSYLPGHVIWNIP